MWYKYVSGPLPKPKFEWSGNIVIGCEPFALPSKKKYVSTPPEPSSFWNTISLSASWFMKYKSPVRFWTIESVALWYSWRSFPVPKVNLDLSGNIVYNADVAPLSYVASPPSNEKYVAVPPLPSSDLNIISPSSVCCSIENTP